MVPDVKLYNVNGKNKQSVNISCKLVHINVLRTYLSHLDLKDTQPISELLFEKTFLGRATSNFQNTTVKKA